MFERLVVKDFEAHESRTIDLAKVTTFVGRSDVGKSSLLRLLRWVCLNQPAGTAFVRWGAPYARGVLTFDGHELIRRAGDKNIYKFDGKVYKAFGRGVPPEVEAALNVSEHNFQQQAAGQFWLCESAAHVSKELNAIVDLGVIDDTMAFLAAKTRAAKAAVGVAKERLEQAKTQRKALKHVPGLVAAWNAVKDAQQQQEAKRLQFEKLCTLVQNAKEAERQAAEAQERLETATSAQEAATKASELAKTVQGLNNVLTRAQLAVGFLDSPQLDNSKVQAAYETWQKKLKAKEALSALLNDTNTAIAKAAYCKERVESSQAEAAKCLGAQCPLCSQPIRTKR